jgi:putative ABC transport system permease protein
MQHTPDVKPPRWPLKILRFFIRRSYLEEIEGDMEELFFDQLEQMPLRQARRAYACEVLKLMRPVLMENLSFVHHINPYPMFKNYFKTSLRSLMKNPTSSFINVFGLAVAIGVCIVVYAFMQWTYGVDQFHEYKNEVYLATISVDREGNEKRYGMSPRPLADMLKQDFAQVKKACRVEDRNVVIKSQDNIFQQSVRYTDPEFLEMFTFPLKWGQPGSLADPSSIILSEEMSVKYFGTENPLGRDIQLIFDEHRSKVFKVTGVAAGFPKTYMIGFQCLVNFDNLATAEPGYDATDWKGFVNATLIQVSNPARMAAIEQGMDKYKRLQHAAEKDWPVSSFTFEPIATLHERSGEIINDISSDPPVEARVALPLIGLFILVLACFNYVNIAIVSATKRLKEIGVRKVVGANRAKVVTQFLMENMVISCFALAIGFTLGATLFVPWLAGLTGQPLQDIRFADKDLWLFLLGVMLFTSLTSGLYPAFYISRFDAVRILKGSLQFGKRNYLTKVFLGFQLVLSCILISGAVMFSQNTTFQNGKAWGYDQKEVLYAHVDNGVGYERLRHVMAVNPDVISVAGSGNHLGQSNGTIVLHLPQREYEVQQLAVGAGYFETMGLQLLEGRTFKTDYESDRQAVVVNKLFTQNMNWKEPVGQQFEIGGTRYDVVGVVADFHHRNFYHEVRPMLFTLAAPQDYRYLSMKVKAGSEQKTFAALKQQWAKLFPETPFQGGFQQDVWGVFFHKVGVQERFSKGVAFIAILLASLGFYGLVRLNVSGRGREFTIRKVLGAGLRHITGNITREYAILTVVSMAIAAPISHLLTKSLLTFMYAYPPPINYSGTAISVGILISILLATVFAQVFKVSKDNLVSGLKTE